MDMSAFVDCLEKCRELMKQGNEKKLTVQRNKLKLRLLSRFIAIQREMRKGEEVRFPTPRYNGKGFDPPNYFIMRKGEIVGEGENEPKRVEAYLTRISVGTPRITGLELTAKHLEESVVYKRLRSEEEEAIYNKLESSPEFSKRGPSYARESLIKTLLD